MKERKFKESYRLVDVPDGKTGRETRRAEYAGARYRFPAGSPPPRRRAAALSPLIFAYWIAAAAYLRTARVTSRTMYALLPMLLGLLPGAYAVMGLWSLFSAPESMTVVQKEKGPGRLARSLLGCGALSLICCAGAAAVLSRNGLWPGGWHEAALPGLAGAAGLAAFARSRRMYGELEEIPPQAPADNGGQN